MKKAKSNNIACTLIQSILYLFCVTAPFAQLKNTKIFFKPAEELSACYEKYILDSIGEFFLISGCENKMTVSLGNYTLSNNTVNFHFKPINEFTPVLRTEERLPENDSMVKLTILSCLTNPVPASFRIDAIENSGQFLKSFTVNEKGEVYLNANKYKYLRFTTLNHYFAGWQYLYITHKNQKIFLHLPYSFLALNHPRIRLFNDFAVLLKSDGLYDLHGKNRLFMAER